MSVPESWLLWVAVSGGCLLFTLGCLKVYDLIATVQATKVLRRELRASLERQREQQLKAIVQGRR